MDTRDKILLMFEHLDSKTQFELVGELRMTAILMAEEAEKAEKAAQNRKVVNFADFKGGKKYV